MRQLLNATYAASVEWLDPDDRKEFDRNLALAPSAGDEDRGRNVEQIMALMGGPPMPRAPRPPAVAGEEVG